MKCSNCYWDEQCGVRTTADFDCWAYTPLDEDEEAESGDTE